jgi:4,5-dihydroxyphthalate decarboxylase
VKLNAIAERQDMNETVALRMVTKDYDFLAPLACGDVAPEGIRLTLERDTPGALDRTLTDASIDVGELSFSRQITRLANGDRSFVGIPVFPQRAFRHRCLFVRRGSGLSTIESLAGKRIGCNEWPASGNVWTRSILRTHDVRIDRISWSVGSVDGKPSDRPQGTLPPYVKQVTDRTLLSMLLAGELDALMCPHPPAVFYEEGSPVVRLLEDFRSAEIDYFRRTGTFPCIHVIGVRRAVYEKQPWVLGRLFDALEASKLRWQSSRRALSDTTPWTLAEIEDATRLFGRDWYPYGVERNRSDIEQLSTELHEEGLAPKRLGASEIFPEFQALRRDP